MKKTIVFAALLMLAGIQSQAQRYAVVDTKFILDKLPEYKEAQKRLDDFSELWQKEIDDKQAALDKMYKSFEAEQVLLSDELKKEA